MSTSWITRRAHGDCNAWFWCKERRRAGCWERQTGRVVGPQECLQISLSLAPGSPPGGTLDPDSGAEERNFTSFAAGYIVDQGENDGSSLLA